MRVISDGLSHYDRTPYEHTHRTCSESTTCNCSLKKSTVAMRRNPLAEVSPHANNVNSPGHRRTQQHDRKPHSSSFECGKSFVRDSQSALGPHASHAQTQEQQLHTMQRSAASHVPDSLSLTNAAAAEGASSMASTTWNTKSLQRTSSLVLPAVCADSEACESPLLAASAHRGSFRTTARCAGQHEHIPDTLRASCPVTLQGSLQQTGRFIDWPVQGQARPTVQIPTPPRYGRGRYAASTIDDISTPLKLSLVCSPISPGSTSQVHFDAIRLVSIIL